VLHTHSIWRTSLSDFYFDDGGLKIEGYEILKGLAGVTTHEHSKWFPIFDNTQNVRTLTEQVHQRLKDSQHPIPTIS